MRRVAWPLSHLPAERIHATRHDPRVPVTGVHGRPQQREHLAPCADRLLQVGVAMRVAEGYAERGEETSPRHLLHVIVLQPALLLAVAGADANRDLLRQAAGAQRQLVLLGQLIEALLEARAYRRDV